MSTDIGGLGVWSYIDNLSAAEAAVFARRLESWGYSALWVPEAVGRDPFAILAWLAAHTSTLEVESERLAEAFLRSKGCTLALVNKVRGHDYSARPVATMRAYLEGMERALYMGPEPAAEAPIVLAALRQNMLQLAAEKTRGAHPYFVPPEHTARARELLGPEAWLCPEQNYQNNLREYGFDDRDFADGGSDRLVDAIVAWGNETAIRARIEAHRSAGANHVCIQPFRPDGEMGADLRVLELLAPTAN